MKTIKDNEKILQRELSLCKPVFITLKDNLTWGKSGVDCYGIYYPRKFTHKIVLHSDVVLCDIMLFATMAHEFVHAWQSENGYIKLRHNKDRFPEWVEYFKKAYYVDIVNMALT